MFSEHLLSPWKQAQSILSRDRGKQPPLLKDETIVSLGQAFLRKSVTQA